MILPQGFRHALAVLLLVGFVPATSVRAADADKIQSSLQWIPEDAAFYSSSMRNREQLEILLKSKAWAKFTKLPFVQEGMKELKKALKEGLEKDPKGKALKDWYGKEDNQELIALVGDMFSDEFFFLGGDSVNGFIDLFQRVHGAASRAPIHALLQGNFGFGPKAQVRAALLALAENPDLIRVPDFTIGFKLRNKERGVKQLARLEALLKEVAKQAKMQDRLERKKLGNGEYLILTFDGSLIPWDEIPIEDFEEKVNEFKKVIEKIKKSKCVLSLGLRDDYLLFSISSSTDYLANLGKGKKLIDRAELKPLLKHADKRLTGVDYVSKALRAQVAFTKNDLDRWVFLGKELIERLDLTEKKKKAIEKDIDDLAKDVAEYLTVPGTMLTFSFLNDRGIESYSYEWGEHRSVDSSKPLTVLNHVGGSPIMVLADRTKYQPEEYQKFVRWLKTIHKYAEEFGVTMLPEESQVQYEEVKKIAVPLLQRWHKATGDLLLPSLADGQSALILDAKLTSKKWHKDLPETKTAMPILELAIVQGVSDADKLRQACAEYRAIFNEAAKKISDGSKGKIQPFEWPAPESRKLGDATMYFYPIPEKVGLDKKLLPNATLSKNWLVLSLSEDHSSRLMKKSPLKLEGGPLGDLDRPRCGASYFDWAGFLDALSPWIELAADKVLENPPPGMKLEPKEVRAHVKAVVELFKVLRYTCSSTSLEDGALVRHSETVFRDIDK